MSSIFSKTKHILLLGINLVKTFQKRVKLEKRPKTAGLDR